MMPVLKSILVRTVVAGAILLSPAAFSAGNYTQGFASTPTDWTPVNGGWSASGGSFRNQQLFPGPGSGEPTIAFLNSRSWQTNYTYSVKVLSEYPAAANKVGLVFGYTDPTHYYRVLVDMDGELTLDWRDGANPTRTLTSGNTNDHGVDLQADVPFTLQVFVNGPKATVRVNGKLVAPDATLGTLPVDSKIGVIASSDYGHFDDANIVDNVARQLFSGSFDKVDGNPVEITAPNIHCSGPDIPEKSCFANISGDDSTGFSWPIKMWGDGDPALDDDDGAKLQYISRSTTGEVYDFVDARIESQPGHDGSGAQTFVLRQWLKQGQDHHQPQIPYIIRPKNTFAEQTDLYIRYWLQYPNGLSGWWQMPWQFKTDDDHTADSNDSLRLSLFAVNTASFDANQPHPGCDNTQAGHWRWRIQADRGDSTTIKWAACNQTAEVPLRQWFKVEIFFHRARTATGTARVWVAIDGQEILDFSTSDAAVGRNLFAAGSPIERIMLPQMYGGDDWQRHQLVDDLEIWDSFPADASPH
ncbi:MAG TPA: hypothetical protein VGO61_12955 [Steroidobacteraceae bacterium]|jgi:hypothetical protein|nr:hypothetical protein [Steroidobacteraceae bacterium]